MNTKTATTTMSMHCAAKHIKMKHKSAQKYNGLNTDQEKAKCKSQISSVQQTSEQCAEAMIAASWSIWIAAVGPIEVTSVKNMLPPSYTDTLVTGMAQPTLSAYRAVHTVGACIVSLRFLFFALFIFPHCQPFCELLPVHTQFLDKPFLWKSRLKPINAGGNHSVYSD